MSRALTEAAELKPEIRLAQAVSEFGAALDGEDKARFQAYRGQQAPDAFDVFRLTAEIDSNKAQRKFSRQYVGPRLTSVLQSVQEFSSIVDVIVGSSQNLLAGSVWGVVKLSLLLALGVSSFFDHLSTLFMEIGRQCPRYQQFGAIFSKSKKLQKSLCEYYIAICKLCQKAVTVLNRSGLLQTPLNAIRSFNSQFGPLRDELITRADTISHEVQVLSEQASHDERFENSKFRALSAKLSSTAASELQTAAVQRKEKARLHLLDKLSKYDHQKSWKRARKNGATPWIKTRREYIKWKEAAQSSVLWCKGRLGSGKTVLAANIVEDLITSAESGASVAFFFCSHDENESLQYQTIVRSLARQLVAQQSGNLTETHLRLSHDFVHEDAILDLLKDLLPSLPRQHFVLIDGLDECSPQDVRLIWAYISQLLDLTQTFKILITSRTDSLQSLSLRMEQPHQVLSFAECGIERDEELGAYIENELQDRLESGALQIGNDPRIALQIRDKLLSKADGMFLWVALQFDHLCAQTTDDAISRALEDLPQSLEETFDRILETLAKVESASEPSSHTIYSIVMTAHRPLTLEELKDALSVEIGETHWDPKKQLNDINKVLQRCGCLLVVDEDEKTIRFTHQSFKQHLSSTTNSHNRVDPVEANKLMGKICVTYLNSERFVTAITRPKQSLHIDPVDLASASLSNPTSMNQVALKLLRRSKKATKIDIAPQLQTAAERSTPFLGTHHAFLNYAQEFWPGHTKHLYPVHVKLLPLWSRVVFGGLSNVFLPWSPGAAEVWHLVILAWAVSNAHMGIACLTIKRLAALVELERSQTPNSQLTQLYCLSGVGADEWHKVWGAAVLLKKQRFTNLVPVEGLADLLLVGVRLASREIVATVFTRQPDVYKTDNVLAQSLYLARNDDKEEIVDQIFEHVPDTYWKHLSEDPIAGRAFWADVFGSKDGALETLLQKACYQKRPIIARFLLNRGADVNFLLPGRYSALEISILKGSPALVSLLLEHGADPNTGEDIGDTALTVAAREGYLEIVQLLLDHGARTNERNGTGSFALYEAASGGRVDIARLLLEYGALPGVCGWRKDTPLHAASRAGFGDIVGLLLKYNADPNALGRDNETPLHRACRSVGYSTVRLLLESGASPDASNLAGENPLHLAASLGLDTILQLLLDHGAHVDATDIDGVTPLHLAARYLHVQTFKLLLDRGADVNAITKVETTVLEEAMTFWRNFQEDRVLSFLAEVLEHAAMRNMSINHREAAWIVACKRKSPDFARELLKRGFDPTISRSVRSLMNQAMDNKNKSERKEFTKLLAEYGINVLAVYGINV